MDPRVTRISGQTMEAHAAALPRAVTIAEFAAAREPEVGAVLCWNTAADPAALLADTCRLAAARLVGGAAIERPAAAAQPAAPPPAPVRCGGGKHALLVCLAHAAMGLAPV